MDLSNNIIKLREQKGITQAAMARTLDMVQSNYARLEKRGNKLTLEQIEKIADVLEVPIADLLGIELASQQRITALEQKNTLLREGLSEFEKLRSGVEQMEKQIMLYDELFKEKTQRSKELREWAKDMVRSVEAGDLDATDKIVRLIKELYLSPTN